MCDRSKINVISLTVKINKPKSVNMRGYKLPIHVQNSMQKDLVQAKISLKVVRGYFFDSPCAMEITNTVSDLTCLAYYLWLIFHAAIGTPLS